MATTDKNTPAAGDATKKSEPAKKAYKVLSRLDHDGETYERGDTVSLTAKEAKPLLGGAIQDPSTAATEDE